MGGGRKTVGIASVQVNMGKAAATRGAACSDSDDGQGAHDDGGATPPAGIGDCAFPMRVGVALSCANKADTLFLR